MGKIQFDDLGGKDYHPVRAYTQSKLANVLFTRELARRTEGRVCVFVTQIMQHVLYVCLYESFCASLSLSLCVKNQSASLSSVRVSCLNHDCSGQETEQGETCLQKAQLSYRISHCSNDHTLFAILTINLTTSIEMIKSKEWLVVLLRYYHDVANYADHP